MGIAKETLMLASLGCFHVSAILLLYWGLSRLGFTLAIMATVERSLVEGASLSYLFWCCSWKT